jgi:hypothetical protein
MTGLLSPFLYSLLRCPSHGDNGNAWLRFFTAGSGGGKGAASSREPDLKGIIFILSSTGMRWGRSGCG